MTQENQERGVSNLSEASKTAYSYLCYRRKVLFLVMVDFNILGIFPALFCIEQLFLQFIEVSKVYYLYFSVSFCEAFTLGLLKEA